MSRLSRDFDFGFILVIKQIPEGSIELHSKKEKIKGKTQEMLGGGRGEG